MSVNIKENGQLVKTAGLNSQTVIIDNLTTQDATKALSANQGYVLNQNKVDKVTGKGLSTNDYTNEDKAKVTSSDSKITNYEDRGYLGKNVLPLTLESVKAINTTGSWNGDTYIIAGVEWTSVEDSQGILVGFKATRKWASSTQSDFKISVNDNVNGMKVSGCPSNGSDSTYYIVTGTMSSRSATEYGNGATINGATDFVVLRVASGYNANGLTFYPMIREASSSATFVPYAKSNIELDATKIDKTASEIQTSDGQFTTVTGGLMQSCVVDLDPIQNLHGYSKPWTGGSGKNKLPLTVANVKLASTTGTWSGNKYTINGIVYELFANEDGAITSIKATGTATADAPIVLYRNLSLPNGNYMWSASPSGGSGSTYRAYLTGVTASDTGNGATFSISGQTIGVACIISNGYAIPSSGVIFKPQIESGSTKTTFEPYTNICAISGHTSVSVGNCGKNKLPLTLDGLKAINTSGSWSGNTYTINGITFTINTDTNDNIESIIVNGTKSTSSGVSLILINTNNVPSNIKGQNIILSGCPSGLDNTNIMLNSWGTASPVYDTGNGVQTTFPASPTGIRSEIQIFTSNNFSNVVFKPMIRKATDSATFEPYNGYTKVINLGGTYYGGTLDAVSGVLTLDRKFKELNGTEAWNTSGTNGFAITRTNAGINDVLVAGTKQTPMDSNMFPNSSNVNVWTDGYIGIDNGTIWIGDTNLAQFTDLATFKTFLSNNHLQIVYPLATPQTIQLTPTQLETLVGQNDVFAPLVGQTLESVEYREVLAIDDVPKAIPYENVAPDMGTGEDRTYFRIKKYGRLVQLEFIQSNYWMVVEQQTKVVFGVLPDGYYDKQPSSMLHPDVEFEYPFVNETATNQYDNKKLFINMVNGEVYSVYQANDEIHPMGSITYILDHD